MYYIYSTYIKISTHSKDMNIHKKIIYTCFSTSFVGLLLLSVEGYLRIQPPNKELSRLIFFNEFKISRWTFLSERHDQLNVSWILNIISKKSQSYEEVPEPYRPAFDRLPTSYFIQTNSNGFREAELPSQSKPSIVLLGDSVGFGKGVKVENRFSSLLQTQFPDVPFYNLSLQGCTMDCMSTLLKLYGEQLNPKLIIVQTSSNDIDQTLWKEGLNHKITQKQLPKFLLLSRYSYLFQFLQIQLGHDTFQDLNQHSVITEKHYEQSTERIFKWAESHQVKVLSLNLPFAYEWNYGGHLSRPCVQQQFCNDLVVELKEPTDKLFSMFHIDKDKIESSFAQRTAEELQLSLTQIEQVFPTPEYYLDVVHLSRLGHAYVAKKMTPVLDSMLNEYQSKSHY